MLNLTDVPNVLNSAANLGSNSLLVRPIAISQLAFLSGSSDSFKNGSIYSSSSSSGGFLYLGEGIHIVTTSAGDDQIYLGSGNDQVFAGEGNNSLFLGEGFSIAVTDGGNDTIYGGAASDIVNAGKGNNILYLGEGVNVAITGLGDDLIYTGAAADIIKAGDGNNKIYAAEGDNFVFTGTGSDLIYTGSGNDVIFSGAGNDTIYASEGNNFISTGIGNDTVYAGSGMDRFELVTGEGSVTIINFGSNDKIRLGEGLSSTTLSFITQDGDTLVKAGDDLLATLKWTQLSSVAIDDSSAPINIKIIENALDNGTPFVYTDVAKALWNNGETNFNARSLAGVLQKDGATATEIAQAFNYGLGFTSQTIANALDDGATFNYTNIAKGLKNSGKNPNARTIAKLLQDEGASAIQISQALRYGVGSDLSTIADALNEGANFERTGSNNNYIDVAEGLWNSGHSFNSLTLASVLQNEGATAPEIVRALYLGLNFSFEEIADALDDGATFSYTDIAKGLWKGAIGVSEYRLIKLLKDEGAGISETVDAVASATDDTSFFNKRRLEAEYVRVEIKDALAGLNKRAISVINSIKDVYQDTKDIAFVIDPIGVIASEVGTKVVDSVLKGDFEVVTNPIKIVELGQEVIDKGLSPIVDGSSLTSQLLEKLEDSIDPFSLASSYLGDTSKFINSKFKELEPKRKEVHELLDAAGTPQTIATNTVLYTLEGDFKNAWKSFKKDPVINDLIDSVRYAIRGDIRNADESIRSFLRAGGIDVQGIPEDSINKVVDTKQLKEEVYKAFADASGISLKTIRAAFREPGYTTDDQMHAIFSILAYYNIPYVSAGALAVNTGYYIAEASKQFDLKNDIEGLKRLLTAAGSAAKLQNAYDWINAVLALRKVDFDNLGASESIEAYKEVLGSVLEAIDVEDGKEWVFGAFDLAKGNYFGALGNVAIALANVEGENDQSKLRKWATTLNVLIEKERELSSGKYIPIIQEIFTKLEVANSTRINAVLAKGNTEDALREAILLAVEELDIKEVSFEDAKKLVDLVFDIKEGIKTGNFSPVLKKAFSYVGIDDGATQIVDALSDLKGGNYEEVLKGVLSAAKIPGAAGLIEAGKVLRDGIKNGTIDFDLEFEEGEKKALIQILKALGANDAENRADKAEKNFK